jgi:type I restriction enzyme, S subunit
VAINQPFNSQKGFVLKRSQLTTDKLFVEFYLPEYQVLLEKLRQGPHPLQTLKAISSRMFTGPFGSNRTVDMYRGSGIPYIRVKDVLPNRVEPSGLTYITAEKHQSLNSSRVVPGDVLLTIAGRLGTAAVFPPELNEGNITGHIAGIKPQEGINPYYLAIFLNSTFGEFQVNRLGHRTTRPELNLQEVGRILVAVPPNEVQSWSVQVMQAAYQTHQSKLVEAKALLEGINNFALRELGINPTQLKSQRAIVKPIHVIAGGRFDFEAIVTFPQSHFGNEQTTLLSEIVQQVNARVTPAIEMPDATINYVSLANISSNTGELVDFEPVLGRQVLSSSPMFQRGDILFGRMRPYLNKVWLADFDGVCTGEAIVLRPDKNKIDTSFLHALLLSPIALQQVVPLQGGSSLPRVSASDILNVKLPIPYDLDLQKRIGSAVILMREKAAELRLLADDVLTKAKEEVEQMILGQKITI